ncbi:MAG: GIY-YIG nuclease family protein [Verrucomicrobia bacterium]|nr:GIY-YIG nuclease family protein [Cytophagales bacterium]
MKGSVYLIHFSEPYLTATGREVWHYIGWAKNLMARLAHHRKGSGAKFLRAVNERGIHYEIVKVWEDETKDFERLLKNRKPACPAGRNAKCLCPVCRGESFSSRITGFFRKLFSQLLNFSHQ